MNEPTHKHGLAERDWLRREYERLRTENERLRKVANAAIEWSESPLKGEITDAMIKLGLVVTEYRRLTEGEKFFLKPAVARATEIVTAAEDGRLNGVVETIREIASGDRPQ